MAQPFTLDVIQVATPCPAAWNKMVGDARVRHCGDCQQNVYNLSEMTRAAAEALVLEHEGHLCVRYYRRADGTILTADCPVGLLATAHRRLAGWFGAIAASLLALAAFGNMWAHGASSSGSSIFGRTPVFTGRRAMTGKMLPRAMMGAPRPVPVNQVAPPVCLPTTGSSPANPTVAAESQPR